MGGFLETLKGRKKQIDEAAGEVPASSPTTTITITHPQGSSVQLSPESEAAIEEGKTQAELEKARKTKDYSKLKWSNEKQGFQRAKENE
jgi:hypothetical protein